MSGTSDYLNMSDEDFANLTGPGEPQAEADVVDEPQVDAPVTTDEPAVVVETPEPEATADNPASVVEPVVDTPAEPVVETDATKANPEVAPKLDAEGKPVVDDPTKAKATPADKSQEPAAAVTTEVDYKAFHDKMMAPLKANGKMIQLKSPEELIQLAQMGANYTAKLQALAPHRKALLMLENNGLLDEGKLAFLIDLEKRNPEAIKKLVKDAGIDPMDIDTSVEPQYREGNHRVSQAEVNFHATLDELSSYPEGKETLQVINSTWDQASKDLLWENSEVMRVIHAQRENGLYGQITEEMARQSALGNLPATNSFLQNYKLIGDHMVATQRQAEPAKPVVAPQPVAVRAAPVKAEVANNERASAAAPSKAAPRPAKTSVNPLAMSDDEFLKQMENRL